jgi:acetyl esterase/lipase
MRGRSGRLGALALASCLGATACGAQPATAVKVHDGVVYGHGAVGAPAALPAPLRMDLYQPATRSHATRPVVIVIHGGGFVNGNRKEPGLVRIARALTAQGAVVASIDYRLAGQQPRPSPRVAPLVRALPDAPISAAIASAVDDTLTAADYLRAHARRLHIDPRRLGLVGSSAGAITADQVGYALDDHRIKGPRLRFVASLWGGILVPPAGFDGTVAPTQVGRGEPALFAVHGDADPTLPVRLDDALVARARAQRIRTEYHRIAGGGHGYANVKFFTAAGVAGGSTPFDRLLRFARVTLR